MYVVDDELSLSNHHVARQLTLWRSKGDRDCVRNAKPFTVVGGPSAVDVKLGQFLKHNKVFASSNKAQQACKEGLVWVNGKKQFSTYQLKEGDIVYVNQSFSRVNKNAQDDIIQQEKLVWRLANFTNSLLRSDRNPPLHVIYEDDYMAVVFKPAGVHSLTWVNTIKNHLFTLDNVLLCLLAVPCIESDEHYDMGALSRPIPCHRLDSRVCGCLVVAKTSSALDHINTQFAARQVNKEYTALLVGHLNLCQDILSLYGSSGREFLISFPIGNRQAQSVIEVLESTACNVNGAMHRVKLTLLTGRRHQLRIHCALLGCPILGDDLYHSLGKLPSLQERMVAVAALSASTTNDTIQDDKIGIEAADISNSNQLMPAIKPDSGDQDGLNAVRRGQGLFLMSTSVSLLHPNTSYAQNLPITLTGYKRTLLNGMNEHVGFDKDAGKISVYIDEVPRFSKMFAKAKKGAEWARHQGIQEDR